MISAASPNPARTAIFPLFPIMLPFLSAVLRQPFHVMKQGEPVAPTPSCRSYNRYQPRLVILKARGVPNNVFQIFQWFKQ
jgi:hypothetical protein